MTKIGILLVVCGALVSFPVFAAKKKNSKGKAQKVYDAPISVPAPPAGTETPMASKGGSLYQLNSMLGIHVVKGSALYTGIQLGRRVNRSSRVFLAGEYNFSLYSPGSILGLLVGGWYTLPAQTLKESSFSLGLVAGSGFTTAVAGTPTTVFLGFLDLAFSQPMDDLFDFRIQLRPGLMYKYLAFIMNLSIAFRL